MQKVYFKVDASEPVGIFSTRNGKIDFSELGQEFRVDPTSIKLNGFRFPKTELKSDGTWEQIRETFKQEGLPVGANDDPIMVTGDAVHAVSRGAGEGSTLKRARDESPKSWLAFVQSAAKHYSEWEWEDSADVEKYAMKLLTVSGDPLRNFPRGSVIGIRECYKDLMKILEDSKVGKRFVVLGTSGIGKSCFSLFWVCHQAAKKKKVVWKLHDTFNLLDFSGKVAKFCGELEKSDHRIQEVLWDEDAWLILDGGQTCGIACVCHVLVPCSNQKENYAEFCKSQLVSKLYLPVWEEEVISQFLDAFEKHRLEYEEMCVPSKEEALQNYAQLGGVARYVLCSTNTADRWRELHVALTKLDAANCLQMIKSDFDALPALRDVLVHMTRGPITDGQHGKYRTPDFKLATSGVKSQVITALDEKFKADTVNILKELVGCTTAGSYFGYILSLSDILFSSEVGNFA